MKNILIVNGHQYYDVVAKGELTNKIIERATDFFKQNGFDVKYTHIEKGYDIKKSVINLSGLMQFYFNILLIGWEFLGLVKNILMKLLLKEDTIQVMEEVEVMRVKLMESGGLLKGKKYMLSITYNCPKSEFNNPNGFFDGLSLDEANVATHKTFQFVGLRTFKNLLYA